MQVFTLEPLGAILGFYQPYEGKFRSHLTVAVSTVEHAFDADAENSRRLSEVPLSSISVVQMRV